MAQHQPVVVPAGLGAICLRLLNVLALFFEIRQLRFIEFVWDRRSAVENRCAATCRPKPS